MMQCLITGACSGVDRAQIQTNRRHLPRHDIFAMGGGVEISGFQLRSWYTGLARILQGERRQRKLQRKHEPPLYSTHLQKLRRPVVLSAVLATPSILPAGYGCAASLRQEQRKRKRPHESPLYSSVLNLKRLLYFAAYCSVSCKIKWATEQKRHTVAPTLREQ